MRIPSLLPGVVPKDRDTLNRPLPPSANAAKETSMGHARGLRPDFAAELETRLSGWIGQPGTDRYDQMTKMLAHYLEAKPQPGGAPGREPAAPRSASDGAELTVDLAKLPADAQKQLVRLQSAAEGIEAIFVKQLLSQMRRTSFGKTDTGPMADMAKDMMDQAVADSASTHGGGIGLARIVFLDTAQTLVRSAVAGAPAAGLEKKT